MTPQEIFDSVVGHLRAQGQPSFGNELCHYRFQTEDGRTLKCAAGFLITDEEYATASCYGESIEGYKIGNVIHNNLDKFQVIRDNFNLVSALQNAHDEMAQSFPSSNAIFMKNLEWRLQIVAETNKLIYTPPENTSNG